MRIITISRQFGSGGREVGKRLADALGFAYYDREIVSEIARRMQLDEAYVAGTLDRGLTYNIPIHFGRSFGYVPAPVNNTAGIFAEQHKILRELAAKGDCIIVGRAADVLLAEYEPFNVFVHASIAARVRRCQEHARADENYSDKEMEKHIQRLDAERARYRALFADTEWGDAAAYHLCVNTTDREIKKLVPSIAAYITEWFAQKAR
ncbi:MAG: cytidylate kinase-like family protein [Ruminococcaceae bacterium]|nr:cytidylate kinase-like family protein [Oscillospiraceae bacterium]